MILPIVAYGTQVLRRKADDIGPNYPELRTLIANMWDTMYNANGVGLAAPQIGLSIRLFIVDSVQLEDDEDREMTQSGIKKVFINAEILHEDGTPWVYEEGCLSIPDIRAEVSRPDLIRIRYLDENFVEHMDEYDGLNGRIIQHEYDHIQGKLFTDRISALKKRLLKNRLEDISKGKVDVRYKMKFPLR
ncbi:MAG: peptide deformylase [Bacteroidetes bacterium]|nr:peptide deformylase [Bacteroidota bacterium]